MNGRRFFHVAIASAFASVVAQADVHAATRPDASELLVVTLTVKADQRQAFDRLIDARTIQARKSADIVRFDVFATRDANTVVAVEMFKSASAFKHFEDSNASKAFMGKLLPMLDGTPSVIGGHALH